MNKVIYRKAIIILISLLTVVTMGCRQEQSVSECESIVSEDDYMTQRPATYDDIIGTPGGPMYSANDVGALPALRQAVKGTTVVLGQGDNILHVNYRDYIETKAGEIRYNIFTAWRTDEELIKFNIEIVDNTSVIQVKKELEFTGPVRNGATVYMFVIPQNIQPGDYKLEFIISVDGYDYGKIPCTIHVID